eukprot:NODE_2023_length_1714_cov_63.798869_g1728_i0.p1 GENE.NODE_2023_length_1714_cov_63.798869_g1728_i0~~NODE_2023_length_1714_cov_63.798869_g1728_i0.p1  ORF type:complete len:536 (+),score=114.99 NODE_2023_length_1714_cov_63.798869_g1728_i0:55-1608(+)
MKLFLLLCFVVLISGSRNGNAPNIVFIMADDYGWANIGYHQNGSNPEVVTPNLDALAKSGIELDRHYTYKICSPSRSMFFSGRLSQHVNTVNVEPIVRNPNDPISGYAGIPVNMTGIATKMRQGGYRTHMVGKWDAGMATPFHTPVGRGFESWLGYYHHSNDYYTEHTELYATGTIDLCLDKPVDLWDTNKPAYGLNGTAYEEVLFTKRALEIIENHDVNSPLFYVHSFHLLHVPLQVPKEWTDKFSFIDDKERQLYAAMVAYMDNEVGTIVQALQKKGIWDNTLLVFASDNGGPIYKPANASGANNWPLKGGKYSDWEGGVRGNAFVVGGYVPEKMRGKKLTEYVHMSDWYTTFSKLAGVDPFDEVAEKAGLAPVDGLDVWPLLNGSVPHSPHQELHLSNLTLIQGNWKLVTGVQPMTGWQGPQYPNKTGDRPWFPNVKFLNHWEYDCGSGCLYDVFADPTEHNNLADQYPDRVKSMKSRLDELNQKDFHPDRGSEDIQACIQAKRNGNYYGPFVF